jgi:hypothetical protein
MSNLADTVISSLPSPISGNGIFNVNAVVPNSYSLFDPSSANPSTSYSYPLMDPAKLIGTITAPFMNVGIPSYISTLYNNVFNINNNLQNDIQDAAINDRHYPTSFAVQTYVQSQIAGTQVLNNGSGNTYIVNTTVNNTIISQVPNKSLGFQHTTGGKNYEISLLYMDTTANAPRVGATKTVMYGDVVTTPPFLSLDPATGTGKLIFLYAGDNSFFAYMGGFHKYYQFVYVGDSVSFVQAYNGTNWIWLVTNCMGVFSNVVDVSENSTISQINDSDVPKPAAAPGAPGFSTMGGIAL